MPLRSQVGMGSGTSYHLTLHLKQNMSQTNVPNKEDVFFKIGKTTHSVFQSSMFKDMFDS